MGFKSSTFATLFGSVNDLGFLRSAAGLEHGFLIYLIELFLIDLKNQRLNNHGPFPGKNGNQMRGQRQQYKAQTRNNPNVAPMALAI